MFQAVWLFILLELVQNQNEVQNQDALWSGQEDIEVLVDMVSLSGSGYGGASSGFESSGSGPVLAQLVL